MGKIKKILENELVGGTQTTDVYPVTSTKAVYDENNERLDNILGGLRDKIDIFKNAGYLYADVATPTTDPGTPDAKVFYIANGKGTYEKFGGINVTEDDVVVLYWDSSWHKVSTGIASQAKLSELGQKVDKITPIESSNLINPDLVVEGYLGMDGQDYDLARYLRTNNYISILPGQSYKLLEPIASSHIFRRISFYDASKVFISNTDNVSSFTTPINATFVRVTWSISYGTELGLFESSVVDYEPYYNTLGFIGQGNIAKLPDNSILRKKDMSNFEQEISELDQRVTKIEGGLAEVREISIIKSGIDFRFESNDDYILATLDKNFNNYFGGNPVVNFIGWHYNGEENLIARDNIAPMHICGTTIGANHGWPILLVTITSHGLKNKDVGGECIQDGKKFYIMRIVDENKVWMISENIGTKANPQRNTLNVSEVSYNGNTYSVSAVKSVQLYPSILNTKKKVLLNGKKEILNDGAYKCTYVDIVEEYDVMDVDSIVANLIKEYGNAEQPVFIGDSLVQIRNIYRIMTNSTNLSVLIFETIVPKDNVQFDNFMFAQDSFSKTPASLLWYLPNSKPGANNFVTPALWDVVNSVYVNSNYWADINNPVNRVLSFSQNVCFSIGYIKTTGVGKMLKDLTTSTFELRGGGAGKIYPHGVDKNAVGELVGSADIYTGVLYKCYSQKLSGNRISFYHFPVEGKEYVFVDYSQSCTDKIEIGTEFNGKPVSVVEFSNVLVKSDVYNNGVDVVVNYVNNQTSYAVFTIG